MFLAERTAEYKECLVNQGYPSKLVSDQFSKDSAIPRNDLLRTRGKETKKLFPFVITFNPNLPDVGNINRKHLFILQSNPKLKELFPRGSIIPSFRRSKNLKELLAPPRFKTVNKGQTIHHNNGCLKCDRNRRDLWRNFFVESKSFLSFQTGKKYTIHSRLSCDSTIWFIWFLARNVACSARDLPLPTLELGIVITNLLCSQTKQLVK